MRSDGAASAGGRGVSARRGFAAPAARGAEPQAVRAHPASSVALVATMIGCVHGCRLPQRDFALSTYARCPRAGEPVPKPDGPRTPWSVSSDIARFSISWLRRRRWRWQEHRVHSRHGEECLQIHASHPLGTLASPSIERCVALTTGATPCARTSIGTRSSSDGTALLCRRSGTTLLAVRRPPCAPPSFHVRG